MRIDKRLLAWAAPVRGLLAATILLGVAAGICTVLQARFLSGAVSRVFLAGAGLVQVRALLLGLLFATAGRAAALWAGETLAGRAAVRVKTGVRQLLLAQIQALGPAYTAGERSGELANTALAGIEALDAYFSQYLPQLALAALVPAAIVLMVFPLDLVSGLVLLLTAPLVPLFMLLIGGLADRVTRRQWTALSRLSAHFLDVLQGLTTLKLFNRSRVQVQIIGQISERFRETTMGVLRVTFLSALVLELVSTISTAVVAVEIGVRLLYGRLSFEQAFFVLILAPEFYLPLRLLGQRFHAGVAGVTAARRILEVLETPAAASPSPAPPPSLGEEREPGGDVAAPMPTLRFEHVSYAHDDGLRPALRDVSFAIGRGQKVALVGPTGSGKTTLTHLLLRFIEPQAGQISAGGRPLAELAPGAWRSQVAWVPQRPYLFYGTVADNIRLGRPAAASEEVAWAAAQAHADGFIGALPAGYDTLIGERGARLSGGQAQRLALARAFLKDAPFLILDEATANLDPATEALVQEAAARLLRSRTALIVTHRLHTIAAADQIVVLRRGCVEEVGTHAELLARHGLYRRLVAAQAAAGAPP